MTFDPTDVNRPIAYLDPADDLLHLRASGFNKPNCQLVLAALGFPASPPPTKLLAKFAEGHLLEPVIVERLERAGFELAHTGDDQLHLDLAGPGFTIGIHPDGLIVGQDGHSVEPRLLEIKALGHQLFSTFYRTEDIWSLLDGEYAWQVSLAMHAAKSPMLFVVAEKLYDDDGNLLDNQADARMIVQRIDDPPVPFVDILKRGRHIRRLVDEWMADGGVRAEFTLDGLNCPQSYPCPFHDRHDDKRDAEDYDFTSPRSTESDALTAFDGDRTKRTTWAKAAAAYAKANTEEKAAKMRREKARDELAKLHATDADGAPVLRGLGYAVEYTVAEVRGRVDYKAVEAAGVDLDLYRGASSTRVTIKVEKLEE